MSELIRARINPTWAEEVSTAWSQIWTYNRESTERITDEIELQELGGLIVVCSQRTYVTEKAIEIAGYGSTVNLAFDEPGRLTDTEWLLDAAVTSERSSLISQLNKRSRDTRLHGPSEGWFLPVGALEIVGQPELQTL